MRRALCGLTVLFGVALAPTLFVALPRVVTAAVTQVHDDHQVQGTRYILKVAVWPLGDTSRVEVFGYNRATFTEAECSAVMAALGPLAAALSDPDVATLPDISDPAVAEVAQSLVQLWRMRSQGLGAPAALSLSCHEPSGVPA